MIKRFVLLIAVLLAVVTSSVWANPEQEKALLGRWYSENSDALDPDGEMVSGSVRIAGVDEYLANGVTNSQGQVIMSFTYKDGTIIDASWMITAASEWQIKNGSLFEKVIDVRASTDYVKANGQVVSDSDQKEFFAQANFKIEDLIPKGQTSEDIIVSIDATTFVYKTKNDDGQLIEQTKTRTEKNFPAFKK